MIIYKIIVFEKECYKLRCWGMGLVWYFVDEYFEISVESFFFIVNMFVKVNSELEIIW